MGRTRRLASSLAALAVHLLAGSALAEVLPRFTDFPAAVQSRPVAAIDLASHPEARRFASALRRGAARGPNFAGSDTVVTWGCGTYCLRVAVIDGMTGRVELLPDAIVAVDYRKDSRLLVINPWLALRMAFPTGVPAELAPAYYVRRDGRLRPWVGD